MLDESACHREWFQRWYYLSDTGEPIRCQSLDDVLLRCHPSMDRFRRRFTIPLLLGHCASTVFLGLDHSHRWGEGEPVLFETMIFGGRLNDWQARYPSWAQARRGHRYAICAVLLALIAPRGLVERWLNGKIAARSSPPITKGGD